jgi:serine/threonine protein kinase
MEWVRGGSIRHVLRKGALPMERALRWLVSALDALEYVHRHGFVHRDLKPSNMLLREDDRVVLTDFGLAARIGHTPNVRGGGEGTLAYMAPEQREAAHPSADVHALGATMREILSQATGDPDPALLELAAACTRRDPTARPALRDVRSVAAVPRAG